MKETPLLFNAPMVRALLDGSKTQTRRIAKQVPDGEAMHFGTNIMDWGLSGFYQDDTNSAPDMWWLDIQTDVDDNSHQEIRCPHGQSGDRLWVRETFVHIDDEGDKLDGMGSQTYYAASGDYEANTQWLRKHGLKWTPSIHMPRWASRINLEITGVRVERLQDISEADALTEGITYGQLPDNQQDDAKARTWYRGLWETINGAGSWELNPWVWCVSFRRIAA